MRTCCFFGHSEIYGERDKLIPILKSKIEDLILTENVEQFLFGGYGSFDGLCHEVVNILKQQYPHIQTIYVFAYYRPLDESMKDITQRYDSTFYPGLETKPLKFAITYRNQEMIDMSDFCIFYVNHRWGGAAKTLLYAKRKKKNIVNLGEFTE